MAYLNANGFNWSLYPGDSITKHLQSGKLWEPHLTAFIRKFVKSTDTCMDLGANFGWHTLEMARCSKQVIAFEPYQPALKLLKENIQTNECGNITCVDKAISNRIYKAFLCNAYDDNINIGDSFVKDDWNSSMTIGRGGVSKPLPLNGVQIECTTLDELYRGTDIRVDFMKIDIQGCELFCLQGGKELISRCKPCIAIEIEESCLLMNGYGTRELVNYLRELGYELFYLEADYPADHVAVHKDKMAEFLAVFSPYIKDHRENNPVSNNYACGIIKKIGIGSYAAL